MVQTATSSSIVALDIGDKRIGVAKASVIARLPSPHSVISNDKSVIQTIKSLVEAEAAIALVIGLPRNLEGEDTNQTKRVRVFANELKKSLDLPVYLQDESLTSVQAADELKGQVVRYNKGAIDKLAATYILGDFLAEHGDYGKSHQGI